MGKPDIGGCTHKATSDSLNGAESVSIYYRASSDMYTVIVNGSLEFGVTKAQLELLVQSAADTLEMDSR